jgi:hypothetical protein
MAKRGVKRIVCDEEQIEKLASWHCTHTEIADILGISVDTLDRRYAHIIRKAKATVKKSIRDKQIEVALSGSVPMLIWLGKCMLGQIEMTENEIKSIKEILIKIDPSRKRNGDTNGNVSGTETSDTDNQSGLPDSNEGNAG